MGKEYSFFLFSVLFTVLVLTPFSLQAQGEYRAQSYQYQKWLKGAGFSKALKVSRVERKDDMLYFYLDFKYNGIDSTLAAWDIMRNKFGRQNTHDLESQLFYTACNIFKVPPYHLKLVLRNKEQDERFYFKLTYDQRSRSVVLTEPPLGFKAAGMVVDVGAVKNRSLIISTKKDITSKEAVYDAILDMAKELYSDKINLMNDKANKEVAYFRYLPGNEDLLQFSVVGLRQEVLKAEDNIWIARMLNWISGTRDYDWRKVEHIQFSINCKILSRRKMRIDCDIDGRYGSGYYKTTEWQKCIPMAPEFGWYLQKYNDDFKNQIYDLFSQ